MDDERWTIGLAAWILQAGNYPDLFVGDRVDFALEYWSEDLTVRPDEPVGPRVDHLDGARYAVVGYVQPSTEISVLELGEVSAYSQSRPSSVLARPKGPVAGTATLSVDPFFYKDAHAKGQTNPGLIYSWRIESIAMATGPLITVRPGDPNYRGPDEGPRRILDPDRLVWQPLDRTRTDEEDGASGYLLGCRLLDARGRRECRSYPDNVAHWWPAEHDPAVRDALLAAYGDPRRGYHDLTHLTEVLDRLDELGCDDEAVLLAAWFHDAVYDGRPDDEERSARWAEKVLADDPPLAVEVGRLVRLTATHRPEPGDLPGQLLCDADLAVLAAGPARYASYVAGVREEYAAVPDADFRAGRRVVLEDLLAKEHLFESTAARERWEAAARANLSAEIAALS